MTNVTEVERLIDGSEVIVEVNGQQTKRKMLASRAVYIDDIGIGWGVLDRLRELGKEVNGVSVGAKAKEPECYFSQKADYYWRVREWVLKKDENGKLVNRLLHLDMNGIPVWYQLTWKKYKVSKGSRLISRRLPCLHLPIR